MIKPLLLSCLALTLALSSGCLFSKKSVKTKESSAIASEVEDSLKKRWMDKRVAELTAQGLAIEVARTQAAQEFAEKYAFTSAAKK